MATTHPAAAPSQAAGLPPLYQERCRPRPPTHPPACPPAHPCTPGPTHPPTCKCSSTNTTRRAQALLTAHANPQPAHPSYLPILPTHLQVLLEVLFRHSYGSLRLIKRLIHALSGGRTQREGRAGGEGARLERERVGLGAGGGGGGLIWEALDGQEGGMVASSFNWQEPEGRAARGWLPAHAWEVPGHLPLPSTPLATTTPASRVQGLAHAAACCAVPCQVMPSCAMLCHATPCWHTELKGNLPREAPPARWTPPRPSRSRRACRAAQRPCRGRPPRGWSARAARCWTAGHSGLQGYGFRVRV